MLGSQNSIQDLPLPCGPIVFKVCFSILFLRYNTNFWTFYPLPDSPEAHFEGESSVLRYCGEMRNIEPWESDLGEQALQKNMEKMKDGICGERKKNIEYFVQNSSNTVDNNFALPEDLGEPAPQKILEKKKEGICGERKRNIEYFVQNSSNTVDNNFALPEDLKEQAPQKILEKKMEGICGERKRNIEYFVQNSSNTVDNNFTLSEGVERDFLTHVYYPQPNYGGLVEVSV